MENKPPAQATHCGYTHKRFDICDCDCCEQRRARMAHYLQQGRAAQNMNPAHPLSGAVSQEATTEQFADHMNHVQRGAMMIQGEQFTTEELAEIFTRRGAYVVRGQPVLSRKGRAQLEGMRDEQTDQVEALRRNADKARDAFMEACAQRVEHDAKTTRLVLEAQVAWMRAMREAFDEEFKSVPIPMGEEFVDERSFKAGQRSVTRALAKVLLRKIIYAVAGITLGLVLLAVFS